MGVGRGGGRGGCRLEWSSGDGGGGCGSGGGWNLLCPEKRVGWKWGLLVFLPLECFGNELEMVIVSFVVCVS